MKFPVSLVLVAGACLLLAGCDRSPKGVSLVFERYATNAGGGRMAVLHLTNKTAKTYFVPQANQNADRSRGCFRVVGCELRDLTQNGWKSWNTQVKEDDLKQYLGVWTFGPSESMEVVVTLPKDIQRRKVAAEFAIRESFGPRSQVFWTSTAGRALVNVMPRRLQSWLSEKLRGRLIFYSVWCERELTSRDDS